MNPVLKTSLNYIVSIGIAILLLFLIFHEQDPYQLWNDIKNADKSWVLISVCIALFSHLLRAYRWNILMEPLGHTPSLRNSFFAVMVGYMVNILIPRGGEVTRCAMLKRSNDIPVNESFGTVVTERIFDLFCLITCIIIAFFLQFDLLKDFVSNTLSSSFGKVETSTVYMGLGGIFFGLIFLFFLYKILISKFRASSAVQKFHTFKKGLVEGLMSFRQIRKKWQFFASTILIWTCYFYMSYILFFSLEGTSHLGLDAGMAILVLGGLGMAVPVPGGTGSFHYFVVEGLNKIFLIQKEIGNAYAIIAHSSQMIMFFIFGFASFLAIVFISKKRTSANLNLVNEKLAKNSAA